MAGTLLELFDSQNLNRRSGADRPSRHSAGEFTRAALNTQNNPWGYSRMKTAHLTPAALLLFLVFPVAAVAEQPGPVAQPIPLVLSPTTIQMIEDRQQADTPDVADEGQPEMEIDLLEAPALPTDGATEAELSTVAATSQDLPEGISEVDALAAENDKPTDPYSINYFGILYGPGLKNTSSYQATPTGEVDPNRPVLVKNYLALGYNFTPDLILAGTAYWLWKPLAGQQAYMRDPYLRLGYDGIVRTDSLDLYTDLRVHFAVSNDSRDQDMLAGIQSFQILSYILPNAKTTLFLYSSQRVNIFGKQGFGNDLELYLGPAVHYRVAPTVSLTLLYEMQANHVFGDKPFKFVNDGTDLEPGVSWDITQNLNVNPYLNFYPGNKMNFETTSFGMLMSWKLM